MSQMRLNQLTGRWVTIVAERAGRPSDFAPRADLTVPDTERECPFCPEAQRSEPASLEKLDADGNWTSRIIPNLYPAFSGDDGFAVHRAGPVHTFAEGTGVHEVFIYTPDHHRTLGHLGDDAAAQFMLTLKERFAQHADSPNIRYTQAIVNHGREAGASMAHPHGQILGLPFVPTEILDEERAFARFAGSCLICTTIQAELAAKERIVFDTDDVVVVSPYWASSPYELLIMPRAHNLHLTSADDDSLANVGVALRDTMALIQRTLGDVSYNIGVHSAPHNHTGAYHWHMHVWLNLVTVAGFERGTGVMINVVPPEDAAASLRANI